MKNTMVEFTPAILAHLVISGYKWLKVENRQDYTIIEPVKESDSIDDLAGNNAYTIPIHDHQALEMTKKVLLLDMMFYIDEAFIQ